MIKLKGIHCAVLLSMVIFGSACGDEPKEKVVKTSEKIVSEAQKQRDALAQKIEDQVVDYLTCAGVARPSTIKSVAGTLKDRDQLGLQELLMAPDNVGRIIGLAGVTFEGYVVLARNLYLLSSNGLGQALIKEGPAALECDKQIELACTTGGATSTAICSGGKVFGVRTNYNACLLRGDRHDGTVLMSLDGEDRTKVKLEFDGFKINELDQLVGDLSVDVDASQQAQLLELSSEESLELSSFGGVNGTLSCGQTKTLERLSVTHDTQGVQINFSGQKRTKEERYDLKTVGEHLKWSSGFECSCPVAGSGLEIGLPKPLGRADEVATLRVDFVQGSGPCPSVKISLPDWPSTCSLKESAFKDCGRKAIEEVISPLMNAVCQPLM